MSVHACDSILDYYNCSGKCVMNILPLLWRMIQTHTQCTCKWLIIYMYTVCVFASLLIVTPKDGVHVCLCAVYSCRLNCEHMSGYACKLASSPDFPSFSSLTVRKNVSLAWPGRFSHVNDVRVERRVVERTFEDGNLPSSVTRVLRWLKR